MMKKEMIVFRDGCRGNRVVVFDNEQDFLDFFAIYVAEGLKNPYNLGLMPSYGADYHVWRAPLNPASPSVFNNNE